ncbi:MAG: hypothetical protein V3R60_01570, partial [Acidobacteriota bacterium]
MAAGSLVDGEAEDEGTSVWVIMDDGDLVEADEYLLHGPGGILKQSVASPKPQSQQLQDELRAIKYATPRIAMADMLLFYDFNVWHRRCVILKAILAAGLGFQVDLNPKSWMNGIRTARGTHERICEGFGTPQQCQFIPFPAARGRLQRH